MVTRRCIECKHFPEDSREDDDVNVVCDMGMTTMTGCTTCMKFEPFEFTVNKCGDCRWVDDRGRCDVKINSLILPFEVDPLDDSECGYFEPKRVRVANKCGDCTHSDIGRRSCTEHPSAFVDECSEACDDFEPKPVPVTPDEIRETVFEKAVRHYCTKVADTIVEKNRKYGDSYRAVRQECKERYGDPTIPLFIHTFEKERRLKNQDNDDEDAAFDRIGYLVLEEICKELDD